MIEREREKIRQEDLVNIIIQLSGDSDSFNNDGESFHNELSASVDFVRSEAMNNPTEINRLKVLNNELSKENEILKQENLAIKASMNT